MTLYLLVGGNPRLPLWLYHIDGPPEPCKHLTSNASALRHLFHKHEQCRALTLIQPVLTIDFPAVTTAQPDGKPWPYCDDYDSCACLASCFYFYFLLFGMYFDTLTMLPPALGKVTISEGILGTASPALTSLFYLLRSWFPLVVDDSLHKWRYWPLWRVPASLSSSATVGGAAVRAGRGTSPAHNPAERKKEGGGAGQRPEGRQR